MLAAMVWSPDPNALRGTVAVVAGATRGAGRGIAAALGEAGATVICTGRTSRAGTLRSDYDRAETIEETAELVTGLGGTGVPIAVDHLDGEQVRRLAERILTEHGRIDVLVNDIWGGELLFSWTDRLWEHSLDDGLRMQQLAVWNRFVRVRDQIAEQIKLLRCKADLFVLNNHLARLEIDLDVIERYPLRAGLRR